MAYGRGGRRGLNPPVLIGIVIIVVALLLLCGAVVFYFNSSRQSAEPEAPTGTPAPQPDLDVPTARQYYPDAVEAARARDVGAKLASAAGGWTPIIKADNLNSGRTGWTYHFYLPSEKKMLWIAVDRGGEVRTVQEQDWDTPPGLIDDQGWKIDSAEALALAMQTCQATLAADPKATVEARLSLAASERAIVWHIRVTPSDPQGDACTVRIDATTGAFR
jgi:hypothetical protein